MKTINDVAILTSCFFPNTSVGHINRKTISFQDQFNDLINNLKRILKIDFINYIIVIDASPEKFKLIIQNQFNKIKKHNKVSLIFTSFNQKENELIKKNGKGASEIMMLFQACNHAKSIFKNKSIRFYKISARYKIINLKELLLVTRNELNKNDFICRYSYLLNESMTVFFAFNDILDKYLTMKIASQIDDDIGLYIEQIIFNEIISNCFFKTKKFLMPILINNSTISGSHGRKLTIKTQLKQYLATII